MSGGSGEVRTRDLRIKSPVPLPTELPTPFESIHELYNNNQKFASILARKVGVEPTTNGFGITPLSQLSYSRINFYRTLTDMSRLNHLDLI